MPQLLKLASLLKLVSQQPSVYDFRTNSSPAKMTESKQNEKDERPLQLEAQAAARRFGFLPQTANRHGSSGQAVLVKALTPEKKTTTLFLKWSPEEAAFQTWLYWQLESNGFKLIPVFYKTEDAAITVAQKDKYWTCQPYIGSEFGYEWMNFDCSWQHCFAAGETLASLHRSGAKILRRHPSPPDKARQAADLFSNFPNQFAKTILDFRKTAIAQSSNESESISSRSKSKKKASKQCASIARLGQLPFDRLLARVRQMVPLLLESEKSTSRTINHGDFHPGNLLFSSAGVLAAVDWDFACIGSPIYDLSYALFMFCLEPPLNGQIQTELFSSRKTEAFLDGYSHASSSIKSMQRLSLYSEFVHLLMLEWACAELCKSESGYFEHPGFPRLADALVYCCQ